MPPLPLSGTEGITAQRVSGGWLLFLPLPPSTNARMGVVRMGQHCRQILTKEAREYIAQVSFAIKCWRQASGFMTRSRFIHLDCWMVLPRTNADASNYLKCLLDVAENGGMVSDDKFILPRIQGVGWDAKNPEAVVYLRDFP